MDIDHFDPRGKRKYLQPYENLFLACRHCNGKKSSQWPSPELKALGIRFLDCTVESDYGEHIFEDPDSHEVFGVTPAGKYHVRVLDLNADIFIKHRTLRAQLQIFLSQTPVIVKRGSFAEISGLVSVMIAQLQLMIPVIPYRKRYVNGVATTEI